MRILLVITYLISFISLNAQTYPAKDDNGNKIYYRIFSADPNYTYKCIQDNTSNLTYTFLVNDYDATSTKQQFELTFNANNPSQYYIRNRSSRNYFHNMFVVKDLYHFIKPTSDKINAALMTITPLGNNQVTIQMTGSDDLTYYLNAADAVSVNNTVYLENALDSRFAWYILNANINPETGIEYIRITPEVNVQTINRKIIVTGCDTYKVFDITGREIQSSGYYSPGIYLIHTPGKNFKVLVQ